MNEKEREKERERCINKNKDTGGGRKEERTAQPRQSGGKSIRGNEAK